jgi:hypothetical protein
LEANDRLINETSRWIIAFHNYHIAVPHWGSPIYPKVMNDENKFPFKDFRQVPFGERLIFSVVPNPFTDKFTIEMDDWLRVRSIELVGWQGKPIPLENEFRKKRERIVEIDVSHIKPGYYILKMTLANGSRISQQVIKRRVKQ